MLISVITINYNNIAGLKKTVLSVLTQSCKSIEFIIIDGGSIDGSKEYIEPNVDKIDYFVSEPDNGVYHAMNKGLSFATGVYCLFLNSGDFLNDNDTINRFVQLVDSSSDLTYGLIQWEDNLKLWNPKRDLQSFEMAFQTLIPHQGTFFKTEVIKQLGGYKEEFKVVSDWGLMILLLEKKHKSQKIDILVSICEQPGISASFEHRILVERIKFLFKYAIKTLIKGSLYKIKRYFSNR